MSAPTPEERAQKLTSYPTPFHRRHLRKAIAAEIRAAEAEALREAAERLPRTMTVGHRTLNVYAWLRAEADRREGE